MYNTVNELSAFMNNDQKYYLLRQLVWTGSQWFAYFEKHKNYTPLRKWNWNPNLSVLEPLITEHLKNGLDLKVAAFGQGSWFVYHEAASVSQFFDKKNLTSINQFGKRTYRWKDGWKAITDEITKLKEYTPTAVASNGKIWFMYLKKMST